MSSILRRVGREQGPRYLRYALVSVVSVIAGQLTLAFAFGVLAWPADVSNLAGFAAGAVPSYWLNRRWTWRVPGRSRLAREILPFVAMSLLGLLLSTVAVNAAESAASAATRSRALQTAAVMAASLAAFGCVWIGKFVGMDRWLFATGRARARRAE